MTSFDHVGFVFLLLTLVSGLFAGAAAAGSPADGPRRGRLFAALAASVAASLGLAFAPDVVMFWGCSVLTSLSVWPLIAYHGRGAKERAGRVYMAFAISAEVLLAAGLFVAVRAAGTLDLAELPARAVMDRSILTATTLILVGCGIKAGAVPFQAWVPGSFAAAPLPAAVVMAGITTRAGVLAMLRLLPLGLVALDRWGVPVALLGVLGTFYGAVAGVRQRDPRTALANVSVSQTGFLVAAIGMGLVTSAGWPALQPAVLAFVAHSGLAVVALFLALDAASAPGITAASRRVILGVMAVLGLSLAGFPLTGGAGAMALLTDAIARSGLPSARGLVSMLLLAATGTTLVMARVVWLTATAPETPEPPAARRAPTSPLVAIGICSAAAAVSQLTPWMAWGGAAAAGSRLWSGTLPYIVAGLALAGVAAWRAAARR